MKTKINHILITFLFALFCFTACQDEISEIENPNEQETIVPNSALANLMSRTSANSGIADDILDGASCFSVELPVTIALNDITIIIETEAGLEQLEDLLNSISTDDNEIEFTFPITIVFSDYSEIVIENEDQLQTFIDECVANENDVIDCVDFVYPISFSVFNSEFNLIDTVDVTDDESLYIFLDELENDENALIVSLNFPVTLEYANGETIETNSNEELANAIEAAEQFCEDENDNCLEEEVALNIVECLWDVYLYSNNDTDNLDGPLNFTFSADGNVIVGGIFEDPYTTTWELNTTDEGLVLHIESLYYYEAQLGNWLVVECGDNNISLEYISVDGTGMLLERDCDDDLDCSAIEINSNITGCAWNLETNIITDYPNDIYVHFRLEGAVMIEGQGNLESQIGIWEIVAVDSDVFFEFTLQSPFDVLNGQWEVVECEDGELYLQNENNYIDLEEACEVNNQALLECYTIYVLSQECDDNNDGIATFVIETSGPQTDECIALYPIAGSYHPTYQDAVNTTNHLNIQITTPIELESQTIFFRVFNQDTHEYAVQELQIEVEACNDEVFNCFSDFEIVECNQPNNVPIYNLNAGSIGLVDCSYSFSPSFHETLADAENNINAISNTEAYETLVSEVYLRIEADSGNFEVFTIYLNTEDCNYFECFHNIEVVVCDEDGSNDGSVAFDLYSIYANCPEDNVEITFHETLPDAEAYMNELISPFVNSTNPQTIYARVQLAGDVDIFEVFTVELIVSDCSTNNFECFQSFDAVLEACYTDATVLYEFNLEIAFANCTPSADIVTYHETLIEAEAGTNQILNPLAYATANVSSTIYARVEIGNQFEIFPIQLNVINCNAGSCTEGDIDGILTECQWNITSYNGSDNLYSYNFNFEMNSGIVVIYNSTTTIDASWSTSQSNNGVIIEFSNVAGPNIQAINGSWRVVECTAEQLVLHNVNDSNNEIVLDRTCE